MKNLTKIFNGYLNKKEIKNLWLYYTIPHSKFINILQDSQIKRVSIGYNNYGEFMFINFSFKDHYYQAYSLGLHEYRNKIIKNYWYIWELGCNEEIGKKPNIPYKEVLEKIEKRKKEIEKIKPIENDMATMLYNIVADLTDEDSALVELENINLL